MMDNGQELKDHLKQRGQNLITTHQKTMSDVKKWQEIMLKNPPQSGIQFIDYIQTMKPNKNGLVYKDMMEDYDKMVADQMVIPKELLEKPSKLDGWNRKDASLGYKDRKDVHGNIIYRECMAGKKEWWDINYNNDEVHYKNSNGYETWGTFEDYEKGRLVEELTYDSGKIASMRRDDRSDAAQYLHVFKNRYGKTLANKQAMGRIQRSQTKGGRVVFMKPQKS